MEEQQFNFDIAFSYAGEQRFYAKELYERLASRGLKVFYDGGQIATIWGKDLYQYLSDIYQNRAKYCVVFLSKEYADKLWTKHELKAMQARAFKEAEEYILPIRFDNTEIPGLLPTIAYINSSDFSTEEISNLIVQKVNLFNPLTKNLQPNINSKLEIALADAILWADEYLKPQPLELSERLAKAVRQSFKNSNIQPNTSVLKPYLLNENASFRVVGYFAYQIKPFFDLEMELNFVTCLSKEKAHSLAKKQTRPLWQLLVCIHYFLSITKNKDTLLYSLKEMLLFLKSNNNIDTGGQCKQRISYLLNNS